MVAPFKVGGLPAAPACALHKLRWGSDPLFTQENTEEDKPAADKGAAGRPPTLKGATIASRGCQCRGDGVWSCWECEGVSRCRGVNIPVPQQTADF